MKIFSLLTVLWYLTASTAAAHTFYLSSTEGSRPDSARIFVTSFYQGDTIRETLRWKDTDKGYMHTAVRHHDRLLVEVTCPGFNPIRYYTSTAKAGLYFVLGKKGTRYLFIGTSVLPCIPHPNEIYVLYDPRKSASLKALFDRLKVPYKKEWFTAVRPQWPGLDSETQALWKITHSSPVKYTGSNLLRSLRKAHTVVYEAGPVIEVFDSREKKFKEVMLTPRFHIVNETFCAGLDTLEEQWKQKGFVRLQNLVTSAVHHWEAPVDMGTGLIDLLAEINEKFFIPACPEYTDHWKESFSDRGPKH